MSSSSSGRVGRGGCQGNEGRGIYRNLDHKDINTRYAELKRIRRHRFVRPRHLAHSQNNCNDIDDQDTIMDAID